MVSVIIPTYNCGKYLRDAMDSVLNQTYQEMEILVVDDGSTDDTQSIIRQHYPTVRYFYQDNGGAAKARNRGLREARGELIAFLDADDVWLPTKLEKQVIYFAGHPDVGLLSTNQTYRDTTGRMHHDPGKRERLFIGDCVRNIFLYSGVATPTVMLRREVIQRVGHFEECLVAAEDDNLWMRIAFSYKIALIDEPLTLVRGRPDSLTQDFDNIFKGVKAHLEMIQTEYPKIAEHLGSALIAKKYAFLYRSAAYHYYHRSDFTHARQMARESLKYMWNHRAMTYLVASYLPLWLIHRCKAVRNRVS